MKDRNSSKEHIIRSIDITGKICPMTFVYTKLALEELNKDDILEVLLDFPAALDNIPKNCKRQNLAELLEINELNSNKNKWVIRLRKL